MESPGSVPVRYGYNADGQRVATVKGNGSGAAESERFLRFGRGRPMLAELSSGKITTRYIVLPGGQLLARVGTVDSKPVFYHFDALGSTVALTNLTARIISRLSYDPYGSRSYPVASEERFGYVGAESVAQEADGLLEMEARSYQPETGRFLETEPARRQPVGESAAWFPWPQRYRYAEGNPLRWVDPRGLQAQAAVAAAPVSPGLAACLALAYTAKAVSDCYNRYKESTGVPFTTEVPSSSLKGGGGIELCFAACRARFKDSICMQVLCMAGCLLSGLSDGP